MVIFDTNIVLRYLLNDNEEMADKAEEYLDAGDVSVTTEVIAEVVYVLKGVYSMEREEIAETISKFLGFVECRDADAVRFALDTYKEENLDFVDCLLYGYYMIDGAEIATFDKKLLKLLKG